jgi:hypothetical protein
MGTVTLASLLHCVACCRPTVPIQLLAAPQDLQVLCKLPHMTSCKSDIALCWLLPREGLATDKAAKSSTTWPAFVAQVLNALSHMNDNAAAVPGRELAKQIYGRDSVFARNPTPAQVRLTDSQKILQCWCRLCTSLKPAIDLCAIVHFEFSPEIS